MCILKTYFNYKIMMNVTMWWGDDSCMAKLDTSECNSPPPASNSLGSYYLIIVWRYANISMCPINIYFVLPTFVL